MKKIKYFTTPIYYLNGLPHIGHAYTSIVTDVLVRYFRISGYDVFFATGTDEHGMKVAQSAELDYETTQKDQTTTKNNKEITQLYCDKISAIFQQQADTLQVSYDDFIRTTQERHKKSAKALWKAIEKYIYKSAYKGWYSTRDEEFIKDEDLVNGKAPSGADVVWLEEECYYFKLSEFTDRLLKYYEENPMFIMPESRRNEVLSFVKKGLQDLSISRTRFDWGIDVPDDKKHVMYVWIDALTNYLTVLGYPDNMENVSKYMRECTHMVGKEIIRFHAVYWPAFLMAAGIDLPKQVFAHGWWTNSGEKMSKSVGNVIDPIDLIQQYPLDALRFYLCGAMSFGQDGDFNIESFINKINTKLANDYGNLIQRVFSFIKKCGDVQVNYNAKTEDGCVLQEDIEFLEKIEAFSICDFMEKKQLDKALDSIWEIITKANQFVEKKKPWQLAKENKTKELSSVLTILSEAIRYTTYNLYPFMPETSMKVLYMMNLKSHEKCDNLSFDDLKVRLTDLNFNTPEILFSKII